jgi:hypothetical protein
VIVSSNRPWLATVVVGVALPGLQARAAPPPTSVEPIGVRWSGPGECERAERVRRRIAADLGDRVATTPSELDVRASGDASGWHATLELRGAAAMQRRLGARDCDALADAVALVAVIALDPFVLTPRVHAIAHAQEVVVPAPAPGIAPDAAPPAFVRAPEPPPRGAGPRSRPAIHAALRVELGVSAFALPGIGPVVGLAPVLDGGRWRVEMPLRWSSPRERVVRDGVGGRLQLAAANPRGCWVPGRGAIGVPLCAGIEAGAMIARGRGEGLASTTTAASRWVAATLSVAVTWRVHRRFSTWLAVEGAVPFGRPRFHVVADADVHEAGPAALVVAIGGEVHFSSSRRARRRTQ